MRIAWVSPLPPEPSGISDYCAELLPHLARNSEVERLDLFVEEGRRPDPVSIGGAGLAVDSLRNLPARADQYDAIVYHLGNNGDHHAEIYRTLCAVPGVVVLHEYMLHHLIRAVTLARGNPAAYVEEMRYAYGRSGQSMAKRFLASGLPFDTWSYPLFERTVDASRAILVHNEHARERILRSRPAARVGVVPLLFDPTSFPAAAFGPGPEDPAAARRAARSELGLAEGAFVVASFGFVTPAKRLPVTLEAFRRLRREVPEAQYLIVGEVSPHYDFASVLDRGLDQGVRLSGRIAFDAFERAMLAADVAINLRFPTGGETSASLIRLLGLGVPTIVSRNGSFAEIPAGCCLPVDLDETEADLLAAYLVRLAQDPDLRRQIGVAARAYVAEHHSPQAAVDGYLSFLAEVIAARPEPYRAVPPLAPWPEAEIGIELAAEVGGALADLGIDERDDESLRSIADVLSDLRCPEISSAVR